LILFGAVFVEIDANWVIAGGTCLTSVTVMFLWWQIRDDHERSRRSKASELILEWSKNLKEKSSLARKFSETLGPKNSRLLFSQKSFKITIDDNNRELFYAYFYDKNNDSFNGEDPQVEGLDVKMVAELRWDVVCYLNLLEAIMMSYRHGIADKELIFEQFQFLVNPVEGHDVLKEFRKASGHSYPAIDQFVKDIEDQRSSSRGKGKLG